MDGSSAKVVELRPHRGGDVAEEDPARRGGLETDDADANEKAPRRSRRVASLDVFRGLTVALMILVDGAGGEWPVIGHAPWNGCNLADFVMPFFLFIVGMAIPLSLKRIPDRGRAVRRVVIRTLKLLFWGILLQGGYSHAPDELTYGVDMKHVRWCGILQRIALAYLVVAVLEIVTKDAKIQDQTSSGFSIFRMYFSQWIVACCILVIYLSLVYGIYVPDWEFRVRNADSPNYGKILTVTCGTRGVLDPPCNAVGYIDRKILGINHMYQKPAWKRHRACTDDSPHEGPFRNDAPAWCVAPFEPEGILSSLSAVLSTIIGVHYGHVLVHMKSHTDRLRQWVTMGIALLVLGIILHFSHAIPLNKQLYTFSYICVTAGAAGVVFSVLYFLVNSLYHDSVHFLFLKIQYLVIIIRLHVEAYWSDVKRCWSSGTVYRPLGCLIIYNQPHLSITLKQPVAGLKRFGCFDSSQHTNFDRSDFDQMNSAHMACLCVLGISALAPRCLCAVLRLSGWLVLVSVQSDTNCSNFCCCCNGTVGSKSRGPALSKKKSPVYSITCIASWPGGKVGVAGCCQALSVVVTIEFCYALFDCISALFSICMNTRAKFL